MKQRNIPWLGAFIDSLYISLPMISAINFFSITTVLYASVYPYLQEHVPWLRYWTFLVAVGVLIMVLMIFVYKFVVPSLWTFRSKQMFKHESKIDDKLDKLLEKVGKLEEKIK